MKRIISVMLAALILASSIAFAADVPTMTSSAVVNGSDVVLTYSISDNSKICGCAFNIVYDSSKLTFKNAEVAQLINNSIVTVNDKYADNAIRVSWAGANELKDGGNALIITFGIAENASGDVDFKLEKTKMVNADGDKVESAFEGTKVTLPTATVDGGSDEGTAGDSSSSGSSGSGSSTSGGSSFSGGVYVPSGMGSSSNKTDKTDKTDKEPEKDVSENEAAAEPNYEVKLFSFSDVKENDWFYESIRFVNEKGLMSGVSETSFAPNSKLTRAMLVTILYRLQNSPECGEAPFTDIPAGQWYTKPVAWAAENKVVSGMGNGVFAPNVDITREQIAVILYNYAKTFGIETAETNDLAAFNDAGNVSSWAKEHMQWAVGAELINGKGEGKLDPKANATRAEIATVLKRFVENFVK